MPHPVKLKNGETIETSRMELNAAMLRARFLLSVTFMEDGCWKWNGALDCRGYGRFWAGTRSHPAHKWSYEHFLEYVPPDLVMDHTCRNRWCVNPDHVEPVTQRTNVLRGECRAAHNARQTHCIYGHPLSGDNLYRKPNGARQCIACRRKTDKRRGHYAASGTRVLSQGR